MKNLTFKLDGMEMLTKEQMKQVKGGKPCSGYAWCYTDAYFVCGQISGAVDCDDEVSLGEFCQAIYGDDCDFVGGCNCTGN